MTGQALVASSATPKAARYQKTEQALWDRYGLEPAVRFIQLGSPRVRLRVLGFGSGRPVLFLHGTVGPGSWASLIGAIPGIRSFVLERPGWGLSEAVDFPKDGYRRFVADMLCGVLDALGLDRVDVVGGSIGDVWALSLAEHHPSRVDRIVLLGGGPVVAEVPVPGFIKLLRTPVGALLVRLPMMPDRLRSILRDSGHGASLEAGRIPGEFIDWRVALANDTPSMRHERDMVRSILGRSGWRPGVMFEERDLARIGQPTLLVYGTADPTGNADLWRRVMAAMPRGELHVMDRAGHQPWFENAPGVGAQVSAFLAAPAGAPGPV